MPLTPTGSYRLAEQIGGWATFADIDLITMARGDISSPLVELDAGVNVDASGQQIAAIGFGVAHALGYLPDSDFVGVIVTRLHTNPVDTTPMALAFATCHAVLDSLDLQPENAPYFDREKRLFVFPGHGPTD